MTSTPNPIRLGALVAVVLVTSASSLDTYPRQPGIDALHYTFAVTLRDDTDMIAGEATAELRFVLADVTEVFLDLASVTDTTDGKGMRVLGVTWNGRPVHWAHDGDRLRITMDAAPAVGAPVDLASSRIRSANCFCASLSSSPNWAEKVISRARFSKCPCSSGRLSSTLKM